MVVSAPGTPLVRIGELSRRTGVTPELLRMWERRYGILTPQRTEGGFRLYSQADEERVARMQRGIAEGLPASLAARRAAAAPDGAAPGAPAVAPPVLVRELTDALDRFDDMAANAVLDSALAVLSLETVLTELILPYLQELGSRWERSEISIAQEHFATSIVRGRLLGLSRGWGNGTGPRGLLACPPGELHDLGLICFGLTLRQHGWRVVLLGPNTPIDSIRDAAARLDPKLVVVCSMLTDALDVVATELGELGATHRLALAGPGATPELATRTHAWHLAESPTAAARRVVAPAAGLSDKLA